MLAKQHRLIHKKDFTKIYKKGRTFLCDFLVIKYIKNQNSFSRLAVVVSKKNLPKATDRNRLKRKIKSIFADCLPHLNHNIDLLVIANNKTLHTTYAVLNKTIKKFLIKAGLIKNK